jgi:3-oxoadipate enol-lactonase
VTVPEQFLKSIRSGALPTLYFIHGIGGGARTFAPQLASFAPQRGSRVTGYVSSAIDLPGYGTRPPVSTMNFEALAEDVERQIFSPPEPSVPVLVGHSIGGMVVQTMLRRRPLGYAAAVLSCTSPAFGSPEGEFQRRFIADRLAPLDAGRTMSDNAAAAADSLMAPNPDPDARSQFIKAYAAVPEATYRAAVKCLTGFDERANLSAIKIPVLCLAAEHDRNAPPSVVEKMASKIPGAYYFCLAGLGHMPNLEAPRAFDAAIVNFLSRVLEA